MPGDQGLESLIDQLEKKDKEREALEEQLKKANTEISGHVDEAIPVLAERMDNLTDSVEEETELMEVREDHDRRGKMRYTVTATPEGFYATNLGGDYSRKGIVDNAFTLDAPEEPFHDEVPIEIDEEYMELLIDSTRNTPEKKKRAVKAYDAVERLADEDTEAPLPTIYLSSGHLSAKARSLEREG